MPVKSGGSHALSAFLAIYVGYAVKSYLDAHSTELRTATDVAGVFVVEVLASTVGIRIPEVLAGMLAISVAIAFVWGLSYHVVRHG